MKAVVCVLLLSLISGCEYTSNPVMNNAEETGDIRSGNSAGDIVSGVYFDTDVYPILKNNCMTCHTPGSPKDWSNYKVVSQNIDLILSAINHEAGRMPMPLGKGKLDTELIATIQEWADSGLKEVRPVVATPTPTPEVPSTPETGPAPEVPTEEEITPTTEGPNDEQMIAYGAEIYKNNCSSCHDTKSIYANLAGQPSKYLYSQLKAFRVKKGSPGRRVDPIMKLYATSFLNGEKDIKAVSKYLESADPCAIPDEIVDLVLAEGDAKPDPINGQKLFDSQCVFCHQAGGSTEYPNLYGQNTQYLLKQLEDFKSGARSSATMSGMVMGLTRQQMIDISVHLNNKSECN